MITRITKIATTIAGLALITLMNIAPLSAQTDTATVTIPRSALTEAQKAALGTTELREKAQAYGAWVGVGKEVGEAVNSSLSAIGDNASKFADTKAGRFTMGIVLWKVLGEDILGIFYAFIIVFVALPVLVWSYRKHVSLVVLDKELFDDKGKVTSRTYRKLDYSENTERGLALIAHGLGAAILLIALSVAIF